MPKIPPDAIWRTSSRSLSDITCVEVAITEDAVGVRDSKDREGGQLTFGREVWAGFVAGVRDGEFDL